MDDQLEAELMTDEAGRGHGRQVKDITLVKLICDSEGPVASTNEIADAVDISQQAVTRRLHDLREDGVLAAKDAGGALVWWPDFYPLDSSCDADA